MPHYALIVFFCALKSFLLLEVVVRRSSVKKVFLEISQTSQENTCASDSFFNKVEFCEVSKNSFFIEHLRWLLLYYALSTSLVGISHPPSAQKNLNQCAVIIKIAKN